MSQINLFDLAKEIRSALPGWSTKVNITDIFIWEKDPATWQTTAIIKLAPRPAGEIYAVVNSGIPAGNIYGLTQTCLNTLGGRWGIRSIIIGLVAGFCWLV